MANDTTSNQALWNQHAPKVERLAHRLHKRLPQHASVSKGDLISAGARGLLEASNSYDTTRGIEFWSFAEFRVRGAMQDELRSVDPLTRRTRALVRRVEQARSALQTQLGRSPSAQEISQHAGISLAAYNSAIVRAQTVQFAPPTSLDTLPATDASPEEHVALRELTDQLADKLTQLDQRSRAVVLLYYVKNLKMAEIGRVIGVTEARVSQLLSAARADLRDLLAPCRQIAMA